MCATRGLIKKKKKRKKNNNQDFNVEAAVEELGFVSNAQDVAFLRIELHSPSLSPGLKQAVLYALFAQSLRPGRTSRGTN